MKYSKSKSNLIITCLAIGSCLAACNSGNNSSDISDTAKTYTMPADSAANSTDTSAASVKTDTSTMATDTSANKKITTTKSTTKKKGKALAGIMPVVKGRKVSMDKTGVYDYAEVMPKYRGGESALEDYVTNHVQYPQTALDDGTAGRVQVAFTVGENGKVTDVHTVSNKIGDGLDDEAVRVVSSMPDWMPATVKGKPVKARVTLPITFRIEE